MAALETIQNLAGVLRVRNEATDTYTYKQRNAPSQTDEREYVGPGFVGWACGVCGSPASLAAC